MYTKLTLTKGLQNERFNAIDTYWFVLSSSNGNGFDNSGPDDDYPIPRKYTTLGVYYVLQR